MAAKRKVVPAKPAKNILIEKSITGGFSRTKASDKPSPAGGGGTESTGPSGGTDSTGPRMRDDSKKE